MLSVKITHGKNTTKELLDILNHETRNKALYYWFFAAFMLFVYFTFDVVCLISSLLWKHPFYQIRKWGLILRYLRHIPVIFQVASLLAALSYPGHRVLYAPGDSLPCRRDPS
ncbi:hypothetical protein [Photorhabdus heterorhabditis]|uniref:hypothetical protein n=1 Tax=Photorhabdus heterorhabditis TaxID=880156 RepID=UPI001BD40FA4|nr:hypothetical protein [Photorhabdus heterorhabditis]MBS9443585.1 hypothetical protein [Photorhabdus heterorhabditis]